MLYNNYWTMEKLFSSPTTKIVRLLFFSSPGTIISSWKLFTSSFKIIWYFFFRPLKLAAVLLDQLISSSFVRLTCTSFLLCVKQRRLKKYVCVCINAVFDKFIYRYMHWYPHAIWPFHACNAFIYLFVIVTTVIDISIFDW